MSEMICHGPGHGPNHVIKPDERSISFSALIDWGGQDIRKSWQGNYAFCSFACMAEWASAKAEDHDGRHVKEGVPE